MCDSIEEIVREKGVYVGGIQGDSMNPLIYQDNVKIMITRPKFPLKKYDVPVYKRDGHLTMHRIVAVTKKGYIICGDNRINLEKDITDDKIIGVLTGIWRGAEYIDCKGKYYRNYSRFVVMTYPFRRVKHIFKKIFKNFKKSIDKSEKF